MRAAVLVRLVVGVVVGGLVAGCAVDRASVGTAPTRASSSAGAAASTVPRTGHGTLPAGSPLTSCVDPRPAVTTPLDTALAADFAHARVRTAFGLDGADVRVTPPPATARPRISAASALCNLLAGDTAQNDSVLDAARSNGLGFGLGVVTVADRLIPAGLRRYQVADGTRAVRLAPYHSRLAWLVVVKPDVVAACPAQSPPTARPGTAIRAPLPRLPGYQVLAIDADTGADGILYSARANALCGYRGYQPASLLPATEVVSRPWRLTGRGPGPQAATIAFSARSCDLPVDARFGPTGARAVFADAHGLVAVVLARVFTTCGAPRPITILLRSASLTTDLPAHLRHAAVGAQDVDAPS